MKFRSAPLCKTENIVANKKLTLFDITYNLLFTSQPHEILLATVWIEQAVVSCSRLYNCTIERSTVTVLYIQYCKHRMTIVIFKAPSKQNTVVVEKNSSIDMSGLCTVAHQLIKHHYFSFFAQYILIVKLSHINTVLWYYVLYTVHIYL